MSIRMITLTDWHDGTEFRIAAHSIQTYFSTTTGITKVNGSFDVSETVEQIDQYFDIDRLPKPAQEDFESEEGTFHT